MFKKLITVTALSVILLSSQSVSAFVPYQNYTYGSDLNAHVEPQAYIPDKIITGRALNIGEFKNPCDVFTAPDGKVYIADTDNNRIIVLKKDLSLDRTISSFVNFAKKDSFKKPQGLFVDNKNQIYIADTENSRIVLLNEAGELIKIYSKPQISIDKTSYTYKPVRIAVDKAGRMFIVSRNMNKGMIELDKEGEFVSYFGAIKVSPDLQDLLWKQFMTKAQRDASELALPTEYSSNTVDKNGFVYGTVSATGDKTVEGSNFIKMLNPMGLDILRRQGFFPPMGDSLYADNHNTLIKSKLVDLCVRDYGIYSVLDSQKGRIFTYDNDGDLLFVFGGYGNKNGNFGIPTAIDVLQDNRFLITDGEYNQIVVFKPTKYAEMITEAVICQYNRQFKEAQEKWEAVLKYTTKSDIAYSSMGKALMRQHDYKNSIRYFKLGSDKYNYSKAYGEYRKQIVNQYFAKTMTLFMVIILISNGIHLYLKRRKKQHESRKSA